MRIWRKLCTRKVGMEDLRCAAGYDDETVDLRVGVLKRSLASGVG